MSECVLLVDGCEDKASSYESKIDQRELTSSVCDRDGALLGLWVGFDDG